MALFKSGNPTLSEKRFNDTVLDQVVTHENAMTVRGTLNKFGFLFLMEKSLPKTTGIVANPEADAVNRINFRNIIF